jgi:hypothetical protein
MSDIDTILKAIKTAQPEYKTVLPVSGISVFYGPFKIRDQKTISIIAEETHIGSILKNICNILKSCSDIKNPDQLYLADLEFLFLQIRAKSVEENIKLVLDGPIPVTFDLNISNIKFNPGTLTKDISTNKNIKLTVVQPKVCDYYDLDKLDDDKLLTKTIKIITIGNKRHDLSLFKSSDISKILDEIYLSEIKLLQNFLKDAPKLTYDVVTDDQTIVVEGFLRFFT